jgi:hypothetical protein
MMIKIVIGRVILIMIIRRMIIRRRIVMIRELLIGITMRGEINPIMEVRLHQSWIRRSCTGSI